MKNFLKAPFAAHIAGKRPRSRTIFGFAAAGAGLAAFGAHAGAQETIIQDIFTSGSQYGTPFGAQGANATGVEPSPTNLPGGPWQHITGAWYDAAEYQSTLPTVSSGGSGGDTVADTVVFHNNAAGGIALGAYNRGSLHLSAGAYYLSAGAPAGAGVPAKGTYILAGFSSVLNSGSNYGPAPLTNYTGLAVTGSAGALQEYVNGSAVGAAVPFGGAYDPYAETILSYTIDTATGAISEVSFGNSRAHYFFPNPPTFSHSYTANIELGEQGDAGPNIAAISSFILTSDTVAAPIADAKDAPPPPK